MHQPGSASAQFALGAKAQHGELEPSTQSTVVLPPCNNVGCHLGLKFLVRVPSLDAPPQKGNLWNLVASFVSYMLKDTLAQEAALHTCHPPQLMARSRKEESTDRAVSSQILACKQARRPMKQSPRAAFAAQAMAQHDNILRRKRGMGSGALV